MTEEVWKLLVAVTEQRHIVGGNVAMKITNLFFPAPRKFTLELADPRDLKGISELTEGDQVKLTVTLTREEVTDWPNMKKAMLDACRTRGLVVCGVNLSVIGSSTHSPAPVKARSVQETFTAYCKLEKVGSKIKAAGLELLE